MNAKGGVAKEAACLNKEYKTSEKGNNRLEQELARKEKALRCQTSLMTISVT